MISSLVLDRAYAQSHHFSLTVVLVLLTRQLNARRAVSAFALATTSSMFSYQLVRLNKFSHVVIADITFVFSFLFANIKTILSSPFSDYSQYVAVSKIHTMMTIGLWMKTRERESELLKLTRSRMATAHQTLC